MLDSHFPATPAAGPTTLGTPFFECTSHTSGRAAAWVQASGELDIAACPLLEQTLDAVQTQVRLVVLDVHELTFMDISGVHAIVAAAKYARLAGRRLIVLRTSPEIQAVFDLTGVAGEIDSHRLSVCN